MKKKIVSGVLCAFMFLLVIAPLSFRADTREYGAALTNQKMETKTVSYTKKVERSSTLEGGMTSLSSPATNACGPVAGGEILGYWNKYYTNLMPGYQSTYKGSDGRQYFGGGNNNSDKVVNTLISKMNCGSNGTTVSNFKKGLTAYVNEKNMKTTYTSAMNNYILFQTFSFDKYKAEIAKGNPLFIAVKNCSDGWYVGGTNKDTYNYFTVDNDHAMVGYGWRTIDYYQTRAVTVWSPVWYNPLRFVTEIQDVLVQSEELLMVQMGDERAAVVNINYKTNIADCFSVKIS